MGEPPFLETPTAPPSLLELFSVLAKVMEGGRKSSHCGHGPSRGLCLLRSLSPGCPILCVHQRPSSFKHTLMHAPCTPAKAMQRLTSPGHLLKPHSVRSIHGTCFFPDSALWLGAMHSPLCPSPSSFRFTPTWLFSKIPSVFHPNTQPGFPRVAPNPSPGHRHLTLPTPVPRLQTAAPQEMGISSEKSCPGLEKRDLNLKRMPPDGGQRRRLSLTPSPHRSQETVSQELPGRGQRASGRERWSQGPQVPGPTGCLCCPRC